MQKIYFTGGIIASVGLISGLYALFTFRLRQIYVKVNKNAWDSVTVETKLSCCSLFWDCGVSFITQSVLVTTPNSHRINIRLTPRLWTAHFLSGKEYNMQTKECKTMKINIAWDN